MYKKAVIKPFHFQVLTCFLLPQMECQTSDVMGKFRQLSEWGRGLVILIFCYGPLHLLCEQLPRLKISTNIIIVILGQSFPPSNDLHRLSSGPEDDYRSGSAEGNNAGDEEKVWDHRSSVKFQDVGEDDDDLEREVSVIKIGCPGSPGF